MKRTSLLPADALTILLMEHPYREAAERAYHSFRYPLLAFVVIMLIGTVGYWEVAGGKATLLDCAYMTFITIATIGYGEVIDLSASPGGRVFTMVIGFVGVANIFYMTSKMTAFIVESDLNESLRRRLLIHRRCRYLPGGNSTRRLRSRLVPEDAKSMGRDDKPLFDFSSNNTE